MDNCTYNIVCVSDEGYVQHAAVMLCSLFETNPNKKFRIYFFTTDLSSKARNRLELLCLNYNSNISFHELPVNVIANLPTEKWSLIVYSKLFIPDLLPITDNRCLFLDVDIVINTDIEELYKFDLEGNALAAAEDIPNCINHKRRLGMSENDLYINSGVMVCDLAIWRKKYLDNNIFNFAYTISDKIINEQDIIALYFAGSIKILPITWNMVTFYFERIPRIFDKYKPELQEARKNPQILHFACPIKPWYRDCQHPYKYLYRKYLKLTAWKDYKFPLYENKTCWGRTKRIIRNILNEIGLIKDSSYKVK